MHPNLPGMCGGGWQARGRDEDALHSTRYDHSLFSQDKVTSAVNWDDIKAEICRSNIMQRDNIQFARKQSKDLVKLAKEKNKYVSTFSISEKFILFGFTFVPVFIYTIPYHKFFEHIVVFINYFDIITSF